jgi:hypothetical protein
MTIGHEEDKGLLHIPFTASILFAQRTCARSEDTTARDKTACRKSRSTSAGETMAVAMKKTRVARDASVM